MTDNILYPRIPSPGPSRFVTDVSLRAWTRRPLVATTSQNEIVPDSEEERYVESLLDPVPSAKGKNAGVTWTKKMEVIEISSDEEEETPHPTSVAPAPVVPRPRISPTTDVVSPSSRSSRTHPITSTPRSRRIVYSSSSDASDKELHTLAPPRLAEIDVIEISDSSSSEPNQPNVKGKQKSTDTKSPSPVPAKSGRTGEQQWAADDGSILTLNEPPSARKPIRKKQAVTTGSSNGSLVSTPSGLRIDTSVTFDRALLETPTRQRSLLEQGTTNSQTPSSAKTPRNGKKAREAAEQNRREVYAKDLFEELNASVFKNGLPQDTKLTWSKRLLTTAGRARWHRSREGTQTSEIELATKILDCDERIRNTLSHEMCHLACWVINQDPKEGHGKAWKAWASKVMRKHPEIEISTKHNYEIKYPFEWECEECLKVYGRFSKSIRPDECVCGVCEVGKLVPLFVTRATGPPRTKAGSRMAAGTCRDSPRSISRKPTSPLEADISSDSDSDVAILTTALGGVRISAVPDVLDLTI
ncbi:hypothetical protein JAAARDRAFT_38024 [Jaapia argillacea MUCL 33604]|uniref:SprT-like domain-containing protein n=1 Tax=Jaapia argillacea MUCL 33604 TaxID=933084 RepID=A0A067PJ27_9AGAM|nr:hypothetical protein JAAARDRAFT_38024 [Jaapia argillacea MUCL 33604]